MKRLFAFSVLPLAAACGSLPDVASWVRPYRVDVRQGNLVTQEMVAQLKPGLTKDQVRFILGTPLVADAFHADRWDYVYRFRPGRDPAGAEQRRLVVHFEQGKLVRVGGDVVANDPDRPDVPERAKQRVIDIPGRPPAPAAPAEAARQ
jgi:outer membrane protein assembly factor BamE